VLFRVAELGSDFFDAVFRTEEKEKNRDGCGGTGSGVTGDRLNIFVEKLLRLQEDRSVLPRLRSIFRVTSVCCDVCGSLSSRKKAVGNAYVTMTSAREKKERKRDWTTKSWRTKKREKKRIGQTTKTRTKERSGVREHTRTHEN